MPEKLLAVRRQLRPADHQELRGYMDHINRRCGDVSIKWLHLGQAACTLLERGEYQRARQKQRARLANVDAALLAAGLTRAFKTAPTESQRVTADVINVDFMGDGPFYKIAFLLEAPTFDQERNRLTAYLDRQNGVNGFWGEFEPHVSLATIPRNNADKSVLEEFWDIAPEKLTFEPANPTAS